ncbi:MAG: hypothetical protein ABH862_05445 [Candidatus Omnitrophota bacterium]
MPTTRKRGLVRMVSVITLVSFLAFVGMVTTNVYADKVKEIMEQVKDWIEKISEKCIKIIQSMTGGTRVIELAKKVKEEDKEEPKKKIVEIVLKEIDPVGNPSQLANKTGQFLPEEGADKGFTSGGQDITEELIGNSDGGKEIILEDNVDGDQEQAVIELAKIGFLNNIPVFKENGTLDFLGAEDDATENEIVGNEIAEEEIYTEETGVETPQEETEIEVPVPEEPSENDVKDNGIGQEKNEDKLADIIQDKQEKQEQQEEKYLDIVQSKLFDFVQGKQTVKETSKNKPESKITLGLSKDRGETQNTKINIDNSRYQQDNGQRIKGVSEEVFSKKNVVQKNIEDTEELKEKNIKFEKKMAEPKNNKKGKR